MKQFKATYTVCFIGAKFLDDTTSTRFFLANNYEEALKEELSRKNNFKAEDYEVHLISLVEN